MNHHERQKIYDLLSQYFPNARQLKDKKTLTAWGLALEKFPYDDVKTAVINYAISNKFFPDLADITAGLVSADSRSAVPIPSAIICETAVRQAHWIKLYRNRLREELTRLGLPEFSGSTGAEYHAWAKMCMDSGLDVLDLAERARRMAYTEGVEL